MLIRRVRYWIDSARHSEALREEMELHLAEKAAELQADGMTPECARAEARRRFGNVGLKHEESREIWMTRFLSPPTSSAVKVADSPADIPVRASSRPSSS